MSDSRVTPGCLSHHGACLNKQRLFTGKRGRASRIWLGQSVEVIKLLKWPGTSFSRKLQTTPAPLGALSVITNTTRERRVSGPVLGGFYMKLHRNQWTYRLQATLNASRR